MVNKKKKTLFGEAAMKFRLQQCMLVDSGHQDPEHMKEFRMYAWLLTKSEFERTQEWQRLAVANSRDKIASMKQKALKDVEEEMATKKKGASRDQRSESAGGPANQRFNERENHCF